MIAALNVVCRIDSYEFTRCKLGRAHQFYFSMIDMSNRTYIKNLFLCYNFIFVSHQQSQNQLQKFLYISIPIFVHTNIDMRLLALKRGHTPNGIGTGTE